MSKKFFEQMIIKLNKKTRLEDNFFQKLSPEGKKNQVYQEVKWDLSLMIHLNGHQS